VIHGLDHILIAVEDLDAASEAYTVLLGRDASWRGEHPGLGTANALFRLANTYLELISPVGSGAFADVLSARLAGTGEGPYGLAFATDDADAAAKLLRERGIKATDPMDGQGRERTSGAERSWRNVLLPTEQTRGIFMFCIEHLSDADVLPVAGLAAEERSAVMAVDHVVVRSHDAERTREFYGDTLGLRLALDRSFPKFGSRLLFFRTGGLTVEIGSRLDGDPEPDAADEFWGIAYQVPDVDAAVERLGAAGVAVSESREGRKPGTRVATVKDSTHGVPTLLIQPA
jgi:catechol 2,3-dioxygenase-like lactoylglutathione lyase family enzyme